MLVHEQFANGVRLVVDPMPESRSVALGLWVRTGAKMESEDINGISHFIEHMLFKGTRRRSAKQIAQEMDAMGGQLNAFTGKEYTCYYTRVLDRFLAPAAGILADMFFDSVLDPVEISKEKKVVLEEIKMTEDSPEELVHELLNSAFWQGSPLVLPILGTESSVGNLSQDQLREYIMSHYLPSRLVIAVAGRVTMPEAKTLLAPLFGEFRRPVSWVASPTVVSKEIATYHVKDAEQVHLCLGCHGLPLGDERFHVMQLFNSHFGGSMSSRLFQRIREERGLAYSVYSYHNSYQEGGLFAIYAGTSPSQGRLVLELAQEELNQVAKNGLTQEEIRNSKEQIKTGFQLSLESTSNRMHRAGRSELTLGRVLTEQEVLARVDAVSREQVQEMAQYLLGQRFVAAGVGPEGSSRMLEGLI